MFTRCVILILVKKVIITYVQRLLSEYQCHSKVFVCIFCSWSAEFNYVLNHYFLVKLAKEMHLNRMKYPVQVVKWSLLECIWYIFHIQMILDMLKRQENLHFDYCSVLFLITNFLIQVNLQLHMSADGIAPRATDDQIKKASALLRCIDLKDFSVCQFANPGINQHPIISFPF